MVDRPLLLAGDCVPDRRFAADALPGLDAFAGRPEVEAFFDFADLGDFADFDGFGDRWPDLRSLPPLSFSPDKGPNFSACSMRAALRYVSPSKRLQKLWDTTFGR